MWEFLKQLDLGDYTIVGILVVLFFSFAYWLIKEFIALSKKYNIILGNHIDHNTKALNSFTISQERVVHSQEMLIETQRKMLDELTMTAKENAISHSILLERSKKR